uniref:Uncharacterized protein n=1 Tax=uncultured soil bacterium TaxID=164851 RepID=Q6Q225_9BACT|nr:hypothetical protein [uncultured soil bacterium]
MALQDQDVLYALIDVNTGQVISGGYPFWEIAWHPSGRYLAGKIPNAKHPTIQIVDSATLEVFTEFAVPPYYENENPAYQLEWSPDGKSLAFAHNSGQIYIWAFDEAKIRLQNSFPLTFQRE